MPARKKPQPRQQFFNAVRDDKATRSLDTIRWCLRHGGVNIRAEDDAGHTALQIAAAAGKDEVLQVLCDHVKQHGPREDLDVEDEDGRTPLMLAAAKGRIEAVKILSKAGASWTVKSEEGLTARDYAAKLNNAALVAIFDNGLPALLKEKNEEPEDDGDEADEAKAKKWRLGGLDANKQAAREAAIHEARVRERDHVESALGEAPKALWPEVQGVLDSKGRELSVARKEPDLDPALWHCITLNSLKIRIESAALAALPSQIRQLSALSSLIVSQCGLEALPAELGTLAKLRVLEAAGNKLAALPDEISDCPLQVLNVADNAIEDASLLERLPELVTLNVDRNRLTHLPLPEGAHLKSVSAAGNQLASISGNVGKLQMLRDLTLTDNRLEGLPGALAELTPKVLHEVRLQNNPIKDPRVRRFVEEDKPSMVKDLLAHLKKTGGSDAGAGAGGGGKKGKKKGKAKVVEVEEPEASGDDDGDLSALIAQINGGGEDEDED
mmetsp:Transcript_4992/g.16731  ORF Transcript_4992/g.16731 Transcript_4992/m.16731 type:complete len:497 (+) Transcript_4992:37-1527(+)